MGGHSLSKITVDFVAALKAVETAGSKFIKGSESYESAVREELKKTSFKSFVAVSTINDTLFCNFFSFILLFYAPPFSMEGAGGI